MSRSGSLAGCGPSAWDSLLHSPNSLSHVPSHPAVAPQRGRQVLSLLGQAAPYFLLDQEAQARFRTMAWPPGVPSVGVPYSYSLRPPHLMVSQEDPAMGCRRFSSSARCPRRPCTRKPRAEQQKESTTHARTTTGSIGIGTAGNGWPVDPSCWGPGV